LLQLSATGGQLSRVALGTRSWELGRADVFVTEAAAGFSAQLNLAVAHAWMISEVRDIAAIGRCRRVEDRIFQTQIEAQIQIQIQIQINPRIASILNQRYGYKDTETKWRRACL